MLRTLQEAWPYLLEGVGVTIQIAVISIIIGVVIGLLSCLMIISKNRILKAISSVYVWVIRGTPMIVQALVVYFGLPQVIRLLLPGFKITPFIAGIITLSLNAGAYLTEIFRGGIQAVPKGQVEAARSLGLSGSKTMLKVVLPQAVKIAIPSMANQFIITVKDTSILTVIGLREIVNKAGQYVTIRYDYFETYVWVAAFYLAVISVLMVLAKYVEKKLRYESKSNSKGSL